MQTDDAKFETHKFNNKPQKNQSLDSFYFLQIGNMWKFFKSEHLSFWMICFYLFFEFTRPQAIFPSIDVLPWAQLFLIGSLMGAFLDKTVKWVSNPLNKWLIFFAITIYISSKYAYFPEFSKIYYIDFYSWFIVYFLIINIVNSKQRFYIFLIIFFMSAVKISIGTSKAFVLRGFAFTNWGLMGPAGYFQNSGELSILMLTLFPLAFGLYVLLKDKISLTGKLFLIFCWVTPILTIIGASSRGSQIALLLQLVFIFRKKIFRLKPFIFIFLSSIFFYSLLPSEQKLRFESIGEDSTSIQRLLYIEHGWDMMKENPILGVGYYNFAPYYEKNFPNDMFNNTAQLPHNIFIQVGTDAGFVGLFIFFFILVLPFRMSRKIIYDSKSDEFLVASNVGILHGLLGFIIAGQFVTVVYYPFLWIGIAFIVSSINVYNQENLIKVANVNE